MSSIDERSLLDVAQEAARAAADELLARFGRHADGVQSKSTPTDLVSDADLAAEAAIRTVLSQRRPHDAILGEEGGATAADAASAGGASVGGELRWVVDPLDGTVNFLFGIPQFAVSVACEDPDGAAVGVVLDPVRGECFEVTRSGECTLNGEPIRGTTRDDLSTAMIATGFAYDAGVRARQAAVLSRVLPCVRDIRRGGAAALDLCWCACGRFDAYYERGVHAWDVAAGALLAQRAGLEVRELAATERDPWGIAVAPPGLIEPLLGLGL